MIEKPIALDALVFIVNPENPVRALTTEQIQNIYTGKITRWSDIGKKEADIHPYIRNPNSGSQEKMETLVMKGLTMKKWPEMMGGSMLSPFYSILSDADGIGYTENKEDDKKFFEVTIKNIINDLYAKNISKKVSSTKQAKMKQGVLYRNLCPLWL